MFRVQTINRHRFTVDGKGITTLVGLYGCPLQCKYCINKDVLCSARYQEMSPQKLADAVMIDYCYFVASGGGVTLGGGEPLLYAEEICELKTILPNGVNVNMETSLNADSSKLDCVLGYADSMIIDVKSLSPGIYEAYTGVKPDRMRRNLDVVCRNGLQWKCKIRIPHIPGFTSDEDIERTKTAIGQMGFDNVEVFQYVIR